MARIKNPVTSADCSCLHGTPVIVDGMCGCTSTINNTQIPPMPTQPILPAGYVWKWNGTRWIPMRVNTPVVSGGATATMPTFFVKAKTWAQQNPLLALAIGGGVLYFATKGK